MNNFFPASHRENPVGRENIGIDIGNVGNSHSCFFCHKKFDSNRALGGHVRSHQSVESRSCGMVSLIYNPNPIRSLPPLHNTQTGVTNSRLSIPPSPTIQTHQNSSAMAITQVHQNSLPASNASLLHDRPTWPLGYRPSYSEFLKSCIYGSSTSNSNSHHQNHSHFPSTCLAPSSTAPSFSPNPGSCPVITNSSRFNGLTLAQSFNPDTRYVMQCNKRGINAGRGDGRKRLVGDELGLGHWEAAAAAAAAAKRRNVESFGLVGTEKKNTLAVDLLSCSGTKEPENMCSLAVIDEEEGSSDLDLGLRL